MPLLKNNSGAEPITPAFLPLARDSEFSDMAFQEKEPKPVTYKFNHLEKRKFSSDFTNVGKKFRSTKHIYCDCGLLNFTQSLLEFFRLRTSRKLITTSC